MSAATVTAATAGAELRAELCRLADRLDCASTLDELRALTDELSGMLRRARGRLRGLTRATEPKQTPAGEPPSPPVIRIGPDGPITPAAEPESAVRPAEPPTVEPPTRPAVAAERPAPRTATIGIRPDRPLPMAEPQPEKRRRVTTVFAVLTGLWTMLRSETVRAAQRVGRAVKTAVRRTGALAAAEPQRPAEADDHPGECIVCGPGCCSPILTVHGTRAGPLVGRTAVSVQ